MSPRELLALELAEQITALESSPLQSDHVPPHIQLTARAVIASAPRNQLVTDAHEASRLAHYLTFKGASFGVQHSDKGWRFLITEDK